MTKKTREEVERELKELDAKLNDPKEDERINRLVLDEIADEVRNADARTVVRRPTVRK